MEKAIIPKITDFKEYRRLNTQLIIEIDRAKEIYMEQICDKIIDPQREERNVLMNQKT